MPLVNSEPGITARDYKIALRRAGLHEAFENAWDADLEEHDREEVGLGSVSENIIIEKALEAADEDWAFAMSSRPIQYHIIPVDC